jgi:hypothetical protein
VTPAERNKMTTQPHTCEASCDVDKEIPTTVVIVTKDSAPALCLRLVSFDFDGAFAII